jgi:hypothetical protein
MYEILSLFFLVLGFVFRWFVVPGLAVWVVDPVTLPKKIVLFLVVMWLANRNATTEVVRTSTEKKSDEIKEKPRDDDRDDRFEYSVKR